MTVLSGQEVQLKLIPIISSKPKAKSQNAELENSKQAQSNYYVIFLDDLAPKPLVGTLDCACPYCGSINLERWDVIVFAKPHEACCETSIKQSIDFLWETLKRMSLARHWTEQELEEAEHAHELITKLEAKLKVITGPTS